MNDDEATEKFNALIEDFVSDPEAEHAEGDDFIVRLLRENGYPKLAAVYEARTKKWWYA